MSRCEDANFLNVLRSSHITFYGTTYQILHEMYARCLVMYRNIFHKYGLNSVGNCDSTECNDILTDVLLKSIISVNT